MVSSCLGDSCVGGSLERVVSMRVDCRVMCVYFDVELVQKLVWCFSSFALIRFVLLVLRMFFSGSGRLCGVSVRLRIDYETMVRLVTDAWCAVLL